MAATVPMCKKRISLSTEIFYAAQQIEVPFAGFILLPEGYIHYRLSAMTSLQLHQYFQLQVAEGICDLSFILASQTSWHQHIKHTCTPQTPLKFMQWVHVDKSTWGLSECKKMLATTLTQACFDMGKETCLHTDASTLGIGFVLPQRAKESNEEWKQDYSPTRSVDMLSLSWNV